MTGHSQFALFKTERFWPLFVTQAIGAFNDNAFRFSIAMLLIYDLGNRTGVNAPLVNTLSAGLLTLPFFLFSATAGQLADKYDKAYLVRRIKLAEIFVMGLASYSLFTDQVWLQLLCVFLTGTQSAFFDPIKYSILPQHLGRHELMGGTGLIEAGTFLAILAGQLLGGIIPAWEAGLVAVAVAAIGCVASLAVPSAPTAAPGHVPSSVSRPSR